MVLLLTIHVWHNLTSVVTLFQSCDPISNISLVVRYEHGDFFPITARVDTLIKQQTLYAGFINLAL